MGYEAVVVSIRHVSTKVRFAAKMMKRPESNSYYMRLLERESRICVSLSCEHLVKCIDVIYMESLICIVMEYYEGGDLFDAWTDNMILVKCQWAKIFTQVCRGVQYLHRRGIAHRDLKMENIMTDGDLNCRLCDYGLLCETLNASITTTECGTVPYMAPEMLKGGGYCAKKADVWSLGILLYVIVVGKFPWKSPSDVGVREEIVRGIQDFAPLNSEARAVVLRCCDMNPVTRATVDELLDMTFARGMDGMVLRRDRTASCLMPKNDSMRRMEQAISNKASKPCIHKALNGVEVLRQPCGSRLLYKNRCRIVKSLRL